MQATNIRRTLASNSLAMALPLFVFLIPFVALLYFSSFAFASDWVNAYYPAIKAVFAGDTPYSSGVTFNPPWTYLVLSPLALLPREVGGYIMVILNFSGFALLAYKLKATPLALALFVFSPQVIYGAVNANIDWLVCLGFFMPPWLGLFFVLMKPQIGIAVAVYWLYQAWKTGGIRKVLITATPVSSAFMLSVAAYGFWPLAAAKMPAVYWNTSLWPYSIPVGLALLYLALRKQKINHAITASPFLSPYVVAHSWAVGVLGILSNQSLTILVIACLWILQIVTGYPLHFL